jgi:hypothetical protein
MTRHRDLPAAVSRLTGHQRRGPRANRRDPFPCAAEVVDQFEHGGVGGEGLCAGPAAGQDQDVVAFVGGLRGQREERRVVGDQADVASAAGELVSGMAERRGD